MKILLAVDGSKHSQWAEGLLSRVAGGGHHVQVVFVAPVVARGSAAYPTLSRALQSSGQRLVETVKKSLDRFKTSSRVIESNDVAGSILDAARSYGADVIVLGARGLTALRSFLMGSVSHKVVRHAECAVMVAHRPPPLALRVGVAVDGSPSDGMVAEFVERLRLPRPETLTLLHVVMDPMVYWIPDVGFPGGVGSAETFRESAKELTERGRRILSKGADLWRRSFPSVKTQLRKGHPSSQILTAARTGRWTLAVAGRRGISGLERFLMGSVSQKVASHAPCGVLIV